MSRRSSGKNTEATARFERDIPTLSLSQMLKPIHIPPLIALLGEPPRTPDRRSYRPDAPSAPPVSTVRSAARVVSRGPHFHSLSFAQPRQVTICLRRKVRKEVMHALNHAGKGGRQRKRRRNFWSDVSC